MEDEKKPAESVAINGGPLVESVATGGAAQTLVVGPDNGGGGVDLSGDPAEGPWGPMGPLGERFYGPKVLRDILEGALLFAAHERYEGRLLESLRRAVESGLLPGVEVREVPGLLPGVEVREVPQGGRTPLEVFAVAGTWIAEESAREARAAAFRTECMESRLQAAKYEAEIERNESRQAVPMTRPIPMTDLERQTERMNELWRRLESELAATFEGCSSRVRVIVPPKIAGALVFERGALWWAQDFSAPTAITSAPRHVRIAATQHVGALRRALLEDRDSLAAALSDATKALERDILDLTSDGPAPVVTKRWRKK